MDEDIDLVHCGEDVLIQPVLGMTEEQQWRQARSKEKVPLC